MKHLLSTKLYFKITTILVYWLILSQEYLDLLNLKLGISIAMIDSTSLKANFYAL